MSSNILFVCIGNSCRSQMAEAYTNEMHAEQFAAVSAGVRPSKLDPLTVKAMEEVGIDISQGEAQTIDAHADKEFDYVVTVCADGEANCPYIPARIATIHHEFPDPPAITAEMSDEAERLKVYCEVRDEIKAFVKQLPEILEALS